MKKHSNLTAKNRKMNKAKLDFVFGHFSILASKLECLLNMKITVFTLKCQA